MRNVITALLTTFGLVAQTTHPPRIMTVSYDKHGGAPRHPTKPAKRRRSQLPADYWAWTRVATCESGSWRVLGTAYPNPVGVTARNWAWVGGRPLPPGPVPRAQRVYVIRIADRLVHRLRIPIPDQHGCAAW